MLEIDENAVNGVGFPQCHSYGESSEDGLSVLPPHTKVIVTGNNRTKSVLVGLHGVVKKAVGLGGWHWLVLTNGLEVKLQRNALSVLEAPNGHEDHEDDPEYESLQWNNLDNGEFGQFGSDDTQKSQGRTNEPVQPIGSFQKARSRTLSDNSRSKGSDSRPQSSMKIDFSKLETAALLRYWRHFKLMNAIAIPNPSREQLVDAVGRHFMSQQLDELQVIVGFVRAAKRLKTVCN